MFRSPDQYFQKIFFFNRPVYLLFRFQYQRNLFYFISSCLGSSLPSDFYLFSYLQKYSLITRRGLKLRKISQSSLALDNPSLILLLNRTQLGISRSIYIVFFFRYLSILTKVLIYILFIKAKFNLLLLKFLKNIIIRYSFNRK